MTMPAAGQDRRPAHDEVSLVLLANSVLARRRMVVWCAVIVAGLVSLVALLQRRVYTSAASFVPQGNTSMSSFSGLAAQFGLALPVGQATQSPDFYANLVRSREVMASVLSMEYAFKADTGRFRGSLYQVFEIDEADSLLRREMGIRALGAVVSAAADKRTGVVRVAATTRWPELSRQIAVNVLSELNRFNLERRQSQASAERQFTERRLDEVRQELRAAEDRQQAFLQSNRDYQNSPVLRFQQDRLAREVVMRQQVYTTLSQAYEQARIEAVRDTPVITVIERPETPGRPDPRGLLRRGILALLAGLVLGMVLAVLLARFADARQQEPSAYAELERLKRESWHDLVRPWRLLSSRPTDAGLS